MASYYRINITRNDTFYFRVDDEFISSEKVVEMVREFRVRFPVSQGFKISLARWDVRGQTIVV